MAKKLFGKAGGGGKFDRYVVIGIIVVIIVIALVLWGPLRSLRHGDGKKVRPEQTKKTESASAKKEPKKHAESMVAGHPETTARVAIVIDDLGQDLKQANEIAALPARITFAIMPGLPNSYKVAELARQKNREVLIHLPMEHHNRTGKPAPGTLRSDMTPMEFLTTVSNDVESVPGAVGINNHEGSSLTENREAMKFLMAELKARNLMFLDSATSPKSVAHATAKEFGVKTSRRDVFLDNDADNSGSIRKQLDTLLETARKNGKAIGIGHPRPATISELRTWIAEADLQGFEIVPVSKLMQ